MNQHSGIFIQDNPRLSNKISLIFASFVHLLATKPMAKWSKASDQSSGGLQVKNRVERSIFQTFRKPDFGTRFLFIEVFCIYQQPNLWLSGLEYMASHQEVSGLRTRLKFDVFSLNFFKIVQFFSHFCSCAFL